MGRKDPPKAVPLEGMCPRCTLSSPNIIREPVCTSHETCWEAFWCTGCPVKGFLAVDIHHPTGRLFPYVPDTRIADLWHMAWDDWDTPPAAA
jgi:hypothetical protein